MLKTPKEFVKLYGPLALGVILVAAWFLHSRNQSNVELVSGRQSTLVELASLAMERDLASHAADTRFLARLVARHLTDVDDHSLRYVEDSFADFARTHRVYFSLRYLDDNGDEKVRVDKSFSGPVISPSKALQNKSARYYFKESLQAGKNDVYVSEFDLNIEHGNFEIPHRPTLRFGSPVVGKDGSVNGIVVLNTEGRTLLNQVLLQADNGDGTVMLCNGDGYWMLGPTKGDEWGHLLKDSGYPSMASRYGKDWEVIARTDKGQILSDEGLFTFDTVNVIPGAIMHRVSMSPEDSVKRWKIVSRVAPDALRVPWMTLYSALVCAALFFLAAGCWYLADNRVRQAEVESRLRENEERTMAISQSSQDAIIMIDHRGRISHWNPAAERMLGYRMEEVIGVKIHDLLVPEELCEAAHIGMDTFAAHGRGTVIDEVIEVDAVRKDGSLIPVELAISSFQFKGDWYAVGAMRDATQRKQSELELKRSEETSRALINAPTESAMLIEPSGIIVAINEIGAQRLGGTVEEVLGKNAYELIGSELAETRKLHISSVLETGEPVSFEDLRAGRRMLLNVYPVKDPDGSVERIALFARDVTEQREAEAALVRSEQRFRDVSEAVGEFIWETDARGAFKFITEDVIQVLGYTAAELIGMDPVFLQPGEESETFNQWRQDLRTGREPFSNLEMRNITKDGRYIWLQINGVPYYDEYGNYQGYRGAAMNITDRKIAEDAVKASERKLRALAESAYDAIIMVDAVGDVSFWNDSAEQLFGYSEEEALGKPVHQLIAPGGDHAKAEMGLQHFARSGTGPVVGVMTETVGQRKDGSLFPVERSISGFRLGEDWYAVATIRDITERKATEAKLRELATTDSLTGLYNRRRFMELSEREFARSLRYSRQLSMLMLDIDHFKRVNDEHGHDVGDTVLRSLSEISIMALRNADILGRLGGEEFGVLLPETDSQAAHDVAERLRLSIERSSIDTPDGSLNITVSIGVAVLDSEVGSVEKLLKRADVALYEAKQAGRNRVIMG